MWTAYESYGNGWVSIGDFDTFEKACDSLEKCVSAGGVGKIYGPGERIVYKLPWHVKIDKGLYDGTW